MGLDDNAVLDPEFRVRGVERLRVVDGSAMPDLVSAHINACILMMAEKAADLLRQKSEKQAQPGLLHTRPLSGRAQPQKEPGELEECSPAALDHDFGVNSARS